MRWADYFHVTPGVLAIIATCALLGAMVLARFTRLPVIFNYVVNVLLLFGGALLANRLFDGTGEDYGFGPQRTLLISFGGMLVAALLALVVLARDRRN